MNLTLTLILLGFGVGLAAFSWWQLERPRELGEIRLYPAVLLMGIGIILAILALAHLISLQTGIPLQGRVGRAL